MLGDPPRLLLVAKQEKKDGEELLYDYGYRYVNISCLLCSMTTM